MIHIKLLFVSSPAGGLRAATLLILYTAFIYYTVFKHWVKHPLLVGRLCETCPLSPSRFESLEPEMNSQASRVAVVNQVARQLIHSGHPSEKEIKAQQDKLNTRYLG